MNPPTRPDPFRGGDPVGHPLEDDVQAHEPHPPHRLTTYRPSGTEVPRYVGPTDRRRGRIRRFFWGLFHRGR